MISRIPFNEVQQGLYQLLSRGQTVPVYTASRTAQRRCHTSGSANSMALRLRKIKQS